MVPRVSGVVLEQRMKRLDWRWWKHCVAAREVSRSWLRLVRHQALDALIKVARVKVVSNWVGLQGRNKSTINDMTGDGVSDAQRG